jgi:hypothetical protein
MFAGLFDLRFSMKKDKFHFLVGRKGFTFAKGETFTE